MEFLNPDALYGLLALPLLLIPYLVRRQPQRVVFSSLLLFSQQASGAMTRPWRRLRLPPIFFLQLLLLTLLTLALAEPVFSVRVSNVAVILDNSASMQAREPETTRFALARETARDLLGELGATGKVDLYFTVPRLTRINNVALSPGAAAATLESLAPYDLPDVSVDYDTVLRQLARDRKYQRVYFITDHPARGQSGIVRVYTVGRPQGNMAVTSFRIGRSSLANSRLEAEVTVTNFYPRDERTRVLIKSNGAPLASREMTLSAGRSETVSFQGIPSHPYYEAEIDALDPLILDNRRFAVPANTRKLKILAISPRPQALTSLRRITGVSVDIVSPGDYGKTDRSGYDLEIFHLSSPAALPTAPSLFVLPPENNPMVQLGQPVSRVVVSNWREGHPLTRYLNLALFRPLYARPFKPKIPGETVVESAAGGLVFAAEREGVRYLALAFDPFPYLGRENLPISVFTLNFLDWFLDRAGADGNATGEPLAIGASKQEEFLSTPNGEKQLLPPGSNRFARTFFQGIYRLNHGTESELFAVNLQDPTESNLSEPAALQINDEGQKTNTFSTLFYLWPYLLILSLLFFIMEWFFVPRVAPSRVRLGRKNTQLA
jgi:Ca-activated chloride channel family protein